MFIERTAEKVQSTALYRNTRAGSHAFPHASPLASPLSLLSLNNLMGLVNIYSYGTVPLCTLMCSLKMDLICRDGQSSRRAELVRLV